MLENDGPPLEEVMGRLRRNDWAFGQY